MAAGINKKMSARAETIVRDFRQFAAEGGGVKLYGYQLRPAEAILESVRLNLGLTIVLVMPRQAGKDELLCHLKAYLMRVMGFRERGIVEVNPTYKPQTIQSIMRLENRMDANTACRGKWRKRNDYIRYIEGCRTTFLSGDGRANVVGATANLMLIVNEAQDISPAIYDKKFSPMTASRKATRVICGTAWTSETLLARELRAARAAEREDGRQRVFFVTAEEVGKENSRYIQFVEGEIQRMGRNHPFIKTQYFCEEVDAETGMFNAGRLALMQADWDPQPLPVPGQVYAFLLDIAGQDESQMNVNSDDAVSLANAGRDSTTLSIVSVDLASLVTLQAPTYRVVHRHQCTGLNHLTIFGQLKALADQWQPQHIAVDATGVGEGIWAMLDKAFPTRVIPVKFTQQTKSEIGWHFLAIIETGRFRDCAPSDAVRLQYAGCTSEILPGPAKTMRWGVPESARGPDGQLVHDDYILADALVAAVDDLPWTLPTLTSVVDAPLDPLQRVSDPFGERERIF
jgi:hypothetical protein